MGDVGDKSGRRLDEGVELCLVLAMVNKYGARLHSS